jgi:hypothetical protein
MRAGQAEAERLAGVGLHNVNGPQVITTIISINVNFIALPRRLPCFSLALLGGSLTPPPFFFTSRNACELCTNTFVMELPLVIAGDRVWPGARRFLFTLFRISRYPTKLGGSQRFFSTWGA